MNFDKLPKQDEGKNDREKLEERPALDLSPDEMKLFELNREHWKKMLGDSIPAFDSKTGIWGILKMTVKSYGELLSPRGIKVMLNEAKIMKIMKKYRESREGLKESIDSRQIRDEINKAQEEVDLAQENFRKAEEKLLSLLERENKDEKSGF